MAVMVEMVRVSDFPADPKIRGLYGPVPHVNFLWHTKHFTEVKNVLPHQNLKSQKTKM